MNLGSVLRKERKSRKLTLKAVAEKAGISEGFLSQVENDVNSPSVEKLVNICNAIGIEAGDVIKQAQNQEKLVVIRKSEWSDWELPHTGFVTRRFFAPENRRVIDSSIIVLRPGSQIPGRKNIKNSQETLCVLKGTVELVHGEKTFSLQTGDSVQYWSLPDKQMISNKSRGPAVVFWVGTL
ncbi:MAG: helix-turn-helix transcriptional regulator [Deltaproteobacteria bacterium]|nr:helix-turn-helix transcriptional regulator [Deltaproteobacteria bacterium]